MYREKSINDSPDWIKEQVRVGLDIKDATLDIKEEIKNLSLETLISFFEKNKDTTFSKEQKTPDNSAAHIIAYQKTLNLLDIQVSMDGWYGDKTIAALQKFQKNKGLKSQNGVPGPETTRTLLAELKVLNEKKTEEKKKEEAKKIATPMAPEVAKPTENPEKQIETYLRGLGYTMEGNGIYINSDKDFTITIKDGKAEYTRNLLKRLNTWGHSEKEEAIIIKIFKILNPASTPRP